jgi:hypothetical protein
MPHLVLCITISVSKVCPISQWDNMKWWRTNISQETKRGQEWNTLSVCLSEQGAAGQPTGGLSLGLKGLELVATFWRIARFLQKNQQILTYRVTTSGTNCISVTVLPATHFLQIEATMQKLQGLKCLLAMGDGGRGALCNRSRQPRVRSQETAAWELWQSSDHHIVVLSCITEWRFMKTLSCLVFYCHSHVTISSSFHIWLNKLLTCNNK